MPNGDPAPSFSGTTSRRRSCGASLGLVIVRRSPLWRPSGPPEPGRIVTEMFAELGVNCLFVWFGSSCRNTFGSDCDEGKTGCRFSGWAGGEGPSPGAVTAYGFNRPLLSALDPSSLIGMTP